MTRTLKVKRRTIGRGAAIAVGVAAIIWAILTPDTGDLNWVLVVLAGVIAAHGLVMALLTLRRAKLERRRAKADGEADLILIANGNVRRYALLAAKLAAFLVITLNVLLGTNNVTLNRALILFIIMVMSGGAALDADEISDFDALTDRRRPGRLVADPPKELEP